MTELSIMQEINLSVQMIQKGDMASARPFLEDLWARLEQHGEPYYRSIVAHFLADLQSDPVNELAWDLMALNSASVWNPLDETFRPRSEAVISFMPSLHLNVGDAYRRNGDNVKARQHAEAGLECLSALSADEGYTKTIRTGLTRLRDRTQSVAERDRALL